MNRFVFADAQVFSRRGDVEVVCCDGDGFVLYGKKDRMACAAVFDRAASAKIAALVPEKAELVFSHGALPGKNGKRYVGFEYRGDPIKTENSAFEFSPLTENELDYLAANYDDEREYLARLVKKGAMLGAFRGRPVGFIGEHESGAMGLLFVEPEFRRCGLGYLLEANKINDLLARGITPAAHVAPDNAASLALQKKLGMIELNEPVYWYSRK